MTSYTLGFIFDQAFSRVLLIHKQRPDWQKGRLNDIGGKDEEIEWFDVNKLPDTVLPNLHWLIPLAIDKIKNNAFTQFSVFYP